MTDSPTVTQQRELLTSTQKLISANTYQEIADMAVTIAADILEMAYVGIHLYEESQDALVPISWSDSVEEVLGQPPTLGENSLAWKIYQQNTLQTFENLQAVDDVYNIETPFQSEIIVPLGEHGVLLISFTNTTSIDDTYRHLNKILGANVTAALDRVSREKSLRSFEQAVEHSGHAVVITDTDGTIEYVNPVFEEITGYTAEEAIGRNPRILRSGEHNEAFYEELWDTILSGDVWRHKITNRDKDGERFIVDQTIAPITDAEGDIERFVAVNNDITELKERERNLEILNQVVRHDIRNKLQPILAYADILQTEGETADNEYIEQILEAAHDAVEITTTARNVTKVMLQSEEDLRPVRLSMVLEDEIEDIRSNYESATIRLGDDLPEVSVRADDMLASVMRNLLTNAIQHNDKEIPEVTVSATRNDGNVLVQVADNGPGVPDDRKKEVFEQGEKGLDSDGTGLGLYLVDTLVSRYGGEARVEDNIPKGAIFTVKLPVADNG
jgi:PAS domain S-box-containing protein